MAQSRSSNEETSATTVWQARLDRGFAAELLRDGEMLGLTNRTSVIKAALTLLHQHVAEQRMADSIADFYGDQEPPFPVGMRSHRPSPAS